MFDRDVGRLGAVQEVATCAAARMRSPVEPRIRTGGLAQVIVAQPVGESSRSRKNESPADAVVAGRLRWAMLKPFVIAKSKSKPLPTIGAVDVAARYFVYKLFEATNGQPMAWQVLREIGEAPATMARAVERGWVLVRLDEDGRGKVQSGSLTDEGRRLGRKGLRG